MTNLREGSEERGDREERGERQERGERGERDLPKDREARPSGTRSIEALTDEFRSRDYIADRSLATAVFLALELGRPLLLEGEAGVGKTELAKVLAASLGARLIRLQCYEGLDVNTAVYEWNYPRQMLEIRLLE